MFTEGGQNLVYVVCVWTLVRQYTVRINWCLTVSNTVYHSLFMGPYCFLLRLIFLICNIMTYVSTTYLSEMQVSKKNQTQHQTFRRRPFFLSENPLLLSLSTS